ncbi:MAG: apolipoprotein N-acyltransferase [Phycisphaerales bacterium]
MSWRAGFVAGLAHAVLFLVAFPPFDLWPLVLISLAPLLLLGSRTDRPGRAMFAVWLACIPVWLWGHRWLLEVTPLGYPLLAMYQSLFPAVFVGIVALVRPRGSFKASTKLPLTVIGPLVWVGLEFVRGSMFLTGDPRFLIGHPLIAAPVCCQTADLFGAYFVSFLAATLSGLIADLLLLPLVRDGRLTAAVKRSVTIAAVVYLVSLGYGVVQLYRTDEVTAESARVTIAAIQTNVPQDNKLGWAIEDQIADFTRFIGMTREAVAIAEDAGVDIDLVAWPETMVPGVGFDDDTIAEITRFEDAVERTLTGYPDWSWTRWREELSALARSIETPLLIGSEANEALRIEIETFQDGDGAERRRLAISQDRRFNSAYLFTADGTLAATRYDKMRLTPFGEVIPYLNRFPRLEQFVLDLGARGMRFDLDTGGEFVRIPVTLSSGETVELGAPICFESTYSDICRRLIWDDGRKAGLLFLNLTNDGWFANDPGGRAQHLMAGRFRCIENRVPMARAANTGISAAIDSAGRLIEYGPNHPRGLRPDRVAGILLAELPLDDRVSLYGRIGDAFAWLAFGATIALCGMGLAGRRRSRRTTQEKAN